jgi:hypothetical protein
VLSPQNPPDTLPADAYMAKMVPPKAGLKTVPSTFKVNCKSPKKSPSPPVLSSAPILTLQPPTYDNINKWPKTKGSKAGATSYHGVYVSPEYPRGMDPSYHNIEIIVVIACHARHCTRFTELSAASLGNAFYLDYSCDENQAAHQVVWFYAKEVAAKLASLSQEWKNSRLCKELLEVKHDPRGLKEKEELVVHRLTVGGEKATHRKWSKRNTPAQTEHSASASASPAPGLASISSISLPKSLGELTIGNVQPQGSGTKKRKSATPPATEHRPEKRHRDPSKISISRVSSPAPRGKENAKVDSLGKVIPQRINRRY